MEKTKIFMVIGVNFPFFFPDTAEMLGKQQKVLSKVSKQFLIWNYLSAVTGVIVLFVDSGKLPPVQRSS